MYICFQNYESVLNIDHNCSCSWDGKPCEPSSLSTIMTNFGQCQTFNYRTDPVYKTNNTGKLASYMYRP